MNNPKSYLVLFGIVLLAILGWWGLGARHLKVQRSLTLAGQVAGTSTPPEITDPHAQKCFNNLALIVGVFTPDLQDALVHQLGLVPGQYLLLTVNAYLSSLGEPSITVANQASLNQILNLYNTTLLGGGATFNFDYASCSGYRSDGPAVDPKGNFTYSYQAQGTSANGAPAWWQSSTANNGKTGNNNSGGNNGGNNNNGNSGGGGSNPPAAAAFVCPDAPRAFNVAPGGLSTYFCVGDKFIFYIPAGSSWTNGSYPGPAFSYSGPAMSYQFTLTDITPNQTVANDPLYHYYNSGPVTGNVAKFSLSINGAAAVDVTDYVGPPGVNITNPGPNDAYYLYIEGDKVPVGAPVIEGGPVVAFDKNGKKYGSLTYALLQRIGGAAGAGAYGWQPFNGYGGNVTLPSCDANSCGSAYGSYSCIQENGQLKWILTNGGCLYSEIYKYSCPNGSQYACNPNGFTLQRQNSFEPGVSCAQDSDCTAPSGSNAYCISNHCACGSSKVKTLFGYAVTNQVDCTLPAAGTAPTSCSLSFSPSKSTYCVGDTVTYTVNSTPPGINAYVYRSKNGVTDLNGASIASLVTPGTASYTYKPEDIGNYDVYYKVDAGGGHTCDTKHVVASVVSLADCPFSSNPPASPNIVQGVANTIVNAAQSIWNGLMNFLGLGSSGSNQNNGQSNSSSVPSNTTGSGTTAVSTPFFTQNGQQVDTVACGSSVVFNVSGYSQVWLVQTKNGIQAFNGIYNVPSAPYTPNCTGELGSYKNDAYTVVNGQKGSLIGSSMISIVNPRPSSTSGSSGGSSGSSGGTSSGGQGGDFLNGPYSGEGSPNGPAGEGICTGSFEGVCTGWSSGSRTNSTQ